MEFVVPAREQFGLLDRMMERTMNSIEYAKLLDGIEARMRAARLRAGISGDPWALKYIAYML